MSQDQEIENLKNQLERLTQQYVYENCEKLALDQAYGESIRANHGLRTQLELLKAEKSSLEQNCKREADEKLKFKDDLAEMQKKYDVAIQRVILLETDAVLPPIDGA